MLHIVLYYSGRISVGDRETINDFGYTLDQIHDVLNTSIVSDQI